VTGAPASRHDLGIDTLAVVTDTQPKLILFVVDLRFNVAGAGMQKSISDRFPSYPMHFVLKEPRNRLRLSLDDNPETR
jgi:hypothetical protein